MGRLQRAERDDPPDAGAVALVLCLLIGASALSAEDALGRAERLRDEGRVEEAIAAAREAVASDAPEDAKARAQYLVAYLIDFRRNDPAGALAEYRTFLTRHGHPRLTEVARARVAEIEAMTSSPEADLWRAVEETRRSFPSAEPRSAIERFARGLEGRADSPALAAAWELLGDLRTDPRVADWEGAIEAYGRAERMAAEAGDRRVPDWEMAGGAGARGRLADKTTHAGIERRRVRIYWDGVAALALVLGATAASSLRRAASAVRASRLAALLLPWAALTAALAGLHALEASADPENPMTTGRVVLFAALALLPCACSAILARSLGRARRWAAPFASLLAMLGVTAVFCHHFDYFPLFGL